MKLGQRVVVAVGAGGFRFKPLRTKPRDLDKMAKAEIKRVRRAERNRRMASNAGD